MKPFTLIYTPEARSRIRHLHPAIKKEIRAAVEIIAENPWEGKRLQRELFGLFSLRVKNYRIIYTVDETKKVLKILTLGLRRTIYEEMEKK
ncbi:MAG: type II toxin-antitoxin system RelE/ParE family toxin [Deltaproteobacteria bacterium]|nr:type II toxin-antitoxin system RelE/ParE family toxin [Deltaproteobacteria bacterium]